MTPRRSINAAALAILLLAGCNAQLVIPKDPVDAGSSPTDDGGPGPTPVLDSGVVVVGQLDGGGDSQLPFVPPLSQVIAVENDDSVSITFEPVEGARDYRVYPLPANADLSIKPDGQVVVKNATYRCAGNREAPAPEIDAQPMVPSSAIHTQVDQQMVGGHLRTLAEATLGYVYTEPGPGRVPVYAMGESHENADSTCFFARWAATRVKKYTTSTTERTQMLGDFARDDGIVFYVPETGTAGTRQVWVATDGIGTNSVTRYYFPDGAEAAKHTNKMAAFPVLVSAAQGTQPLMRVFYSNKCGWSHDELAAGRERFNRIHKQGDTQPSWTLSWAGLTGPTTLVVEALDTGCPYQGHLSPQSIASVTGHYGTLDFIHEPYRTPAELRAASPTGEVFINGQHDNTPRLPRAIARSFIRVKPNPRPKMDFFADFSLMATPETFTTLPCGVPGGNCYKTWRQQSATFDQMFMNIEDGPTPGTGLFAYGVMMGELWISYGDLAADTNGRFRLSARTKATITANSYLHVTMEVDAYSTARRYPQILISDRDIPVQYFLPQGHTLVIQPRAQIGTVDWPVEYELQICNRKNWDVNDQCPVYDLRHVKDKTGKTRLAPNAELGELAHADQRVRFDIYTSNQRAYLFLDGQPYGCANLPTAVVPTGAVTVTWGDVLYHSSVDHTYAFHAAHLQFDTRRHFDNLGFSSNVPAPAWDESRLPCADPISP